MNNICPFLTIKATIRDVFGVYSFHIHKKESLIVIVRFCIKKTECNKQTKIFIHTIDESQKYVHKCTVLLLRS